MKYAQIRAEQPHREQYFLQRVSRSFALTIPQLPSGLRERVANAYLLCRIVDTIEDEECLGAEEKQHFFGKFMSVINGDYSADAFSRELEPKLCGSTLPAESELVRESHRIVQTFFEFSPEQQAIIRRCLQIMSTGMLHFQRIKNPGGVADLGHLNAYCYYVAGVVGEMLTDLFCNHSIDTACHRDYLFHRASSFGQGLQMTNILKDMWEDRDRGVCWLPRDLFISSGCDPARIDRGVFSPPFKRGVAQLIGIAHRHLAQGFVYTLKIPKVERGMRKFCLWAIGMAVATLQNINHVRSYASAEEIKITRRRLKSIILAANAALGRNWQLQMLFRFATRGLPLAPPTALDGAVPDVVFLKPSWHATGTVQSAAGFHK